MYKKKSWQIQVPAAAVIPEWWALFALTGCKGCVENFFLITDSIHKMGFYFLKYLSFYREKRCFYIAIKCRNIAILAYYLINFSYKIWPWGIKVEEINRIRDPGNLYPK